MTVTYLNSLTSTQVHAAAPLFDAPLRFPCFTQAELDGFLDEIEGRFDQQQDQERDQQQTVPFISVNNDPITLQQLVDAGPNRQTSRHGRAISILDGIAQRLPVVFGHCKDDRVAGFAYYEAAGLFCSSEFKNAAQTALRQAMNPANSTVPGHIELGEPTQLGMNIVPGEDGTTLECHIAATWNEYFEGGKWHRMNVWTPVLTANTKAVISLRPQRSRSPTGEREHQLECTFAELRANSPLPRILTRLLEHKPTIKQKLANAFANIWIFGRLFRGTRISVEIGREPAGHRPHAEPTELVWRGWDGSAHEKHIKSTTASSAYVAIEKLRGAPNAKEQLHSGSHAAQADSPAPLRVRLDAMRAQANHPLEDGPQQEAPHAEQSPDIATPELQAQLEASKQQAAELSARLLAAQGQLSSANQTIALMREQMSTAEARLSAKKTTVDAQLEGVEKLYPKAPFTGRSRAWTFGSKEGAPSTTTTTTTTSVADED